MVFTCSLKRNRDFRSIYARGKSSAGVYLAIYYRKNRLGENRLGITASSKIGGAVVRNRVRRHIKESYRLCENEFQKGYDIVIVARSKAVGAHFNLIKQDMLKICKKLGIIIQK